MHAPLHDQLQAIVNAYREITMYTNEKKLQITTHNENQEVVVSRYYQSHPSYYIPTLYRIYCLNKQQGIFPMDVQ